MSVRPSRKNRARRPLSPVEERVLYYLTGGSTGSFTRILDHPEDIARVIGSNESDVIGALLSLEKRGAIELPESFRKSIHRVEVPVLTPKGEQVLRNYINGDREEVKAIARQVGISEEEAAQMLGMLSLFERP